MAVDFYSNILYYSYDNEQGDSFGTDRLYDRAGWIEQLNDWQEVDEAEHRYNIYEWEELDSFDFRGAMLAEVEANDDGWSVSWGEESSAFINSKGDISFENGIRDLQSIKWIYNLQKELLKLKDS